MKIKGDQMMINRKNGILSILLVLILMFLAACGGDNESTGSETNKGEESKEAGVVNLYTSRHYETDDALFDKFTEKTGIEVNVVKGEEDELMERLTREGDATEADLFYTADAGRLHWAKERDLLQSVESEILSTNIPENYRDVDNQWFGITKRARVIVYAKDRVNPEDLSTYEALTEPEWKGKVLIRSSDNVYNQSLLASFISLQGTDEAKNWAQGIVKNLARDPQGGDRDQAKAVVAGEGDVAVMNTYYFGQLLNSEDPEEVKVAEQLGVFFPNQETDGTHVNVSGIGVTKHAKNKENAIKFIEFLSNKESQGKFAEANYEFPVNPTVEPSELLASWGEFKEQDIKMSELGKYNADALKMMNEVGWK
jgi:iron(III) transport system substrate-binding protein